MDRIPHSRTRRFQTYAYVYLALYTVVSTLLPEQGAPWLGAHASSAPTAQAGSWSELNEAVKLGRNTTVTITGDISWDECVSALGFQHGAYAGMNCQINITSPGITIRCASPTYQSYFPPTIVFPQMLCAMMRPTVLISE